MNYKYANYEPNSKSSVEDDGGEKIGRRGTKRINYKEDYSQEEEEEVEVCRIETGSFTICQRIKSFFGFGNNDKPEKEEYIKSKND